MEEMHISLIKMVLKIFNCSEAIKENLKNKIKNLVFKKFDVGKDKPKGKFEIIYCRFFVHTLDELLEDKLINVIKLAKKKNTMVKFIGENQ